MIGNFKNVCQELADNPKNWLVTGVAGFIGSNILERLLLLDQHVVGLDNFSTGHKSNLESVRQLVSPEQWSKFTFFDGDISSIDDCRRSCANINYVLHQAAVGSVPRSIEDPISTNISNVDGFLNMLVAARDGNVDKFVFAASSSTYGDHPGLPKVEDEIGKPLSPYAVTKLVNELYADVFSRCYGLDFIGLRYFNIFGKRQDPNGSYAAVIPKWVDSLSRGEAITINGTGETSRDFCYVDNAVQANILAACSTDRQAVNQIYNIAVGDRTSLNDLQVMISAIINKYQDIPEQIVRFAPFRVGDVMHSQASIEKAISLLGYKPQYSALKGLETAIPWYLSQGNSADRGS